MKLKNLFYLLLALPMMFVACEEEPQPTPTPEAPKLTLTSEESAFINAEGGEGTITYTLENAVEGTELSATADVDWISVTTGETINYTVAANEDTALRTGVITVAYGSASFTVTIKQLGQSVPDPKLTLTSSATMEFDGMGGNGQITYTLENPISTLEVKATANEAWISNLTVNEGTIDFVVAQNIEEAREAIITVAYGALSFDVKVKQAKNTNPMIVIESSTEVNVPTAGEQARTVRFSLINADETISVAATADVEWITIKEIGEDAVTYDVAENTGSSRVGKITLTYGSSNAVVTVNQAGISAMPIATISAEAREDNSIWDINIIEVKDAFNNEYQSRISFKLAEGVSTRITDGTYSVANGGILVNTQNDNSNSIYRHNNGSVAEDIIAAEITITNNKEAETTTINGTFTVGSGTIAIEWTGKMDGFAYQDPEDMGDEGETEWNEFFCDGSGGNNIVLDGTGAHGVTIRLYLHKVGKTSGIVAGVFPVQSWTNQPTEDFCEGENNGGSKVNGKSLKNLGQVVIEEHAEGWKVTFDITDINDNNYKGTYIGAL